jgi:hypothetical protein
MLILVCLITSSLLLLTAPPHEADHPDIGGLESRFDCILSSTVELRYVFDNVEFVRILTIGSLAVETAHRGVESVFKDSVSGTGADIERIIDFYLGMFDGWSFGLSGGAGAPIPISSRGQADPDGSDRYVLSRPLIGPGEEEISLALVIFD